MPRDPAGWELLYLSWGSRWMGEQPIPQAMHDGWVYAVIVDGSPYAVVRGRKIRTAPGTVLIFHPDCPYGWIDRPRRSSRVMTWLWKTPPTHSALQPATGGYVRIKVGNVALRKLVAVNRQCYREVAVPGELACLALRRARLDLDIILATAMKRVQPPDSSYRANLALQYLRHNLSELYPAKRLCEYLQVSPSALRVLFHRHFRTSPNAVALELRMSRAGELLAAGRLSVKEIAYRLGDQHANDFSRAFRGFFGHSPRLSSRKRK
jgi:AraC-like DNA-binding protein